MNKLINTKYFLTSTIVMLVIVTFLLINKVSAEESLLPETETSPSTNNTSRPPVPGTMPGKIRAEVDNRLQNIKNNQETRESMVKNGRLPTTTLPKTLKDERGFATSSKMKIEARERVGSTTPKLIREGRFSSTSPKIGERPEREDRASTTRPFLKKDGYENEGRSMVEKMLKEKKDNLAKQLNVAIKNLTDLRKRIGSRIEKDQLAGKDLSSVSELLKIADTKLSIARDAVKAIKDYTPTNKQEPTNVTENTDTAVATNQTISSTKVVNLDQIRNLIDKARSAVKDAHRALNDVIVAIAKISGNNSNDRLRNPLEDRPKISTTPTTTSTTSTNQ